MPVKRLMSILLLALYLTSFTEMHEVLRLPILLEHYAEHKNQVSDMSFIEFLEMHYKSDVTHDEHDSQLPFKVPGHSFTAQAIALPTQKIIVFKITPVTIVSYSFTYTEASFSSPSEAIFQPPRLV
jgi:hypothetical protein